MDTTKAANDIASFYIPFPAAEEARRKILTLIRTGSTPTGADIDFLVGPTRSGKSRVVKQVVESEGFQTHEENGNVVRPIVYVTAAHQATPKGMAESLLEALGQPVVTSRTNELERTCIGNLKDQETRLIIFDEVQQLANASPHVAGDFFKNISTKSRVPIVLCGLPEALRMAEANAQLKSRVRRTIRMTAFDWNDNEGRKGFSRSVKTYSDRLKEKHGIGFANDARLDDVPNLKRLYAVSAGLIGMVDIFLREVLALLAGHGGNIITRRLLQEAAEEVSTDLGFNPFAVDVIRGLKPAPFDTGGNPAKAKKGRSSAPALPALKGEAIETIDDSGRNLKFLPAK